MSTTRHRICITSFIVILLAGLTWKAHAQAKDAQAADIPEFSVVSVHPGNPESRPSYRWTASGLSESGNTLFWLIQAAYDLPEERFVEGAPSWTKDLTYDVMGKVDEADQQALSLMPAANRGKLLRKVLADRFGLTFHREPRNFPEYGLVVVDPRKASRTIVPAGPKDSAQPRAETSTHGVIAHGMTMDQLCHNVLGTEARQLVVDQTGIQGKLSFQLHWSRVDMSADQETSADVNPDSDIFSALQQQLGLKLVRIVVPVQVLKIDGVQKPAPN